MAAINMAVHSKYLIGEETVCTILNIAEEEVEEFTWTLSDVSLLEVEQSATRLVIEPLLSGSYRVDYKAILKNGAHHIGFAEFDIQETTKDKSIIEQEKEEEKQELNFYKELILSPRVSKNQEIPHFVKRNARYRGHRESEKVLNSHQEQIYDIRKIYENEKRLTNLVDKTTNAWFHGGIQGNTHKRVKKEEKVYQATPEQLTYPLNTTDPQGEFANIVVKLNNVNISPDRYTIQDRHLHLDIAALGITEPTATLYISYDFIIEIENDDTIGIANLQTKMKSLSERMAELERRYNAYERAYQ